MGAGGVGAVGVAGGVVRCGHRAGAGDIQTQADAHNEGHNGHQDHISCQSALHELNAPFQKTAYFAGLKLSRRVTTRLYTPGFFESGVKKPVRTNWNFSPGFASFRLSSSLQPLRTTTLSGFR